MTRFEFVLVSADLVNSSHGTTTYQQLVLNIDYKCLSKINIKR